MDVVLGVDISDIIVTKHLHTCGPTGVKEKLSHSVFFTGNQENVTTMFKTFIRLYLVTWHDVN